MHLNVTNIIIKEYIFRKHRFVIILIMFILIKQDYKFYFDTRYIINFINRKFSFKVLLNIVIKKC